MEYCQFCQSYCIGGTRNSWYNRYDASTPIGSHLVSGWAPKFGTLSFFFFSPHSQFALLFSPVSIANISSHVDVIRWKFRGCLPRMLFRGCHDVFQPRVNPLAPDRQPTLSAPTTQIGWNHTHFVPRPPFTRMGLRIISVFLLIVRFYP